MGKFHRRGSSVPLPTMACRHAVPLDHLESALPRCLPSYKQIAPVTSLESALPGLLISAENKRFAVAKLLSKLLCLQHLRDPLASVLSKGVITPVESALTENARATPLESAPTKTPGGGVTGHGVTDSTLSLLVHPLLHARVQHAQGYRALLQDGIMKRTHTETCAEPPFRFRAQPANLQLTQFVRQRLSRPNNVAVHLDGNVLIGLARVVLEKLNRLLARPSHRVHSGIHNQPHGAPHFVRELPEFRVRIFVQSKFFAETLRIQGPAFHESRIAHVLAKFRLSLQLLRERNLQVMPRNRFVQRERLHLPLRPRVQVVCVHEITAGTSRLRRARLVVGRRLRRSLEIRNLAHAVRQARQLPEEVPEFGIDFLGNDAVAVQPGVGLP